MGYLVLLRRPHVARLLLGTLVGRLPGGMTALVIALALRDAGAPYGRVGAVTAAYAVATAVGGPALGRLVDRLGQPAVLLGSSVAAGCGYALLAAAPGHAAAAFGGAVLAGAAMPPLEPCLRALWPDVVPARQLATAYALDSAAQQLLYVTGPLAVAGIAAAADPRAALWTAAALGLLGTLVVATAAPARAWTAPPRTGSGLLGPLRSPGLVVLLTALTGLGWALGAQSILIVAYVEARPGVPGGAATLLAVAAFTGMLGALAYGVLPWRAGAATRTWVIAAGMAATYLPLALLPGPLPMTLLVALSGTGLAPLLAAAFGLVAELAPRGTVTEAFAWLVTVVATGVALGSAVGGLVVEHSLTAAAVCAAAGIGAGALVLLTARGLLTAQGRTGVDGQGSEGRGELREQPVTA